VASVNEIVDMKSFRAERLAPTREARENTYRALLEDTCDLMEGLIDPVRVPDATDRLALASQIEAIREYGASVVR
jgi:hypothetical protein